MWDMASQQMHFGNSNLYAMPNEGSVVLIDEGSGRVDITGIGYAIGHYARWIKPGAVRVDSQSSDPLVQVTTFRDDTAGRVSLVLINNSSAATSVLVTFSNGALSGSLTGEQSTPSGYWVPVTAFAPDSSTAFHIALPATSVTSIAGNMTGAPAGTPQASIISTASYVAGPIAPASIASIFASGLAITPGTALSSPLPTSLNGVTVTFQDSSGVSGQAPLFFVSPGQINLEVPPALAAGPAVFNVNGPAGVMASGSIMFASAVPGLFTANQNGTGVAAAQTVQVQSDGTQSIQPVFQCGAAAGSCQPIPLNLRQPQQLYLVFYGTGIRNRASLSDVVLKVGGVNAQVLYAGPQGATPGLDQVNVVAPAVHGSGNVTVQLTVGSVAANPVTLMVQ